MILKVGKVKQELQPNIVSKVWMMKRMTNIVYVMHLELTMESDLQNRSKDHKILPMLI